MQETRAIAPVWHGRSCIIAAPGPSLTDEVAQACRGRHCIAVGDAYRLLPFADVLYACDAAWWDVHKGCPDFGGEKWSSHEPGKNEKLATAEKYGLSLVAGRFGDGFSLDPAVIHYGSNSGFQTINVALLRGADPVMLVGFDMREKDGRRHFFGDHPKPLNNTGDYERFIPAFRLAATTLPAGHRIINCTPDSALDCFPAMPLSEALSQCPPRSKTSTA